ncbi:MAG: hypothetical protein AAGA93_01910 [Actinomycetota bacterium]
MTETTDTSGRGPDPGPIRDGRDTPSGSGPTAGPTADPTAAAGDRRRVALLVAASVVVALLGVSVPVGVALVSRSSSASFADREVLATNRLGAATLDLQVDGGSSNSPLVELGEGPQAIDEDTSNAVFVATNLAPGDRVSGHLEMTNRGDLPLRYGLQAVSSDGMLAEWLRFEAWVGSGICSPDQAGPRLVSEARVSAEPAVLLPLATPAGATPLNVLEPGESTLWCLGATLLLETPNEAQGQALDVTLFVPIEQVVEVGP